VRPHGCLVQLIKLGPWWSRYRRLQCRIVRRPLLARYLHDALSAEPETYTYDSARQLTVDRGGSPVVEGLVNRGDTVTKVRTEPTDPAEPSFSEPTGVVGDSESFTRTRTEPTDPAEPTAVTEAIETGGWDSESSGGLLAY
jgi:hypothetical protein